MSLPPSLGGGDFASGGSRNPQKCGLRSFSFAFDHLGGSTRPHKVVGAQGKVANCEAFKCRKSG